VLVEAPGDFTLLYDAGSIAGGRRAAQTVRSALWSRDRVRLDAVVVSHADMDHYNAVAGLAESLPVGSILLPHSAIDFRQSALAQMCEAAAQAGTPLRLIQAGDRIQLGPHMACSVLHPAGGRGAAEDNANSAVLLLEFAGRRVLLTGDLEGEGLSRLLSLPPRSVDVLLAPHHGSVRANPVALAEWAAPGVVVASTADVDVADRLRCIYADRTDVHATSTSGAVTVTIDARGDLCVETLLTPRSPAACTH
jgi:competence protein ComEC